MGLLGAAVCSSGALGRKGQATGVGTLDEATCVSVARVEVGRDGGRVLRRRTHPQILFPQSESSFCTDHSTGGRPGKAPAQPAGTQGTRERIRARARSHMVGRHVRAQAIQTTAIQSSLVGGDWVRFLGRGFHNPAIPPCGYRPQSRSRAPARQVPKSLEFGKCQPISNDHRTPRHPCPKY